LKSESITVFVNLVSSRLGSETDSSLLSRVSVEGRIARFKFGLWLISSALSSGRGAGGGKRKETT
jgi:hypothetical protein